MFINPRFPLYLAFNFFRMESLYGMSFYMMKGRFVLPIFAALSELEREQTLQRQREWIAIAKAQGKYKGRQPIAIDWLKFGQLYEQWKSAAITAVWFQKEMGLRANTFYRRLRECERGR